MPRITRPPREAIVVLLDTSGSMGYDGFTVPRLDFDPVNRLRARGDVRVGDTVRFISGVDVKDSDGEPIKCLGRTMPREITGLVHEMDDDDDDEESASSQPEVVKVAFRFPFGYTTTHYSDVVKKRDLEVLTAAGTAACQPLNRIETVKQLFGSFANRSMAYDLPHVIGLTTFSSNVTVLRLLPRHSSRSVPLSTAQTTV